MDKHSKTVIKLYEQTNKNYFFVQNVRSRGGDSSAGTGATAAREIATPWTDPASARPDTPEETARKVRYIDLLK